MMVRDVTPSDAPAWLRLRRALWPHHAEAAHAAEITEFLEGHAPEPLAVLVVADGAGQLIGFAELSIRAYAGAATPTASPTWKAGTSCLMSVTEGSGAR